MGGVGNGPRGIVQNIAALIKQIIQNQISYLKLTVTSLVDFVKDELKAILGLPVAFVQAVRDLLHGNISGAINDVLESVLHLVVAGLQQRAIYGNDYVYSWLGALPDLWHILQIPANELQNLADLLKPLGFGFAGKLVQGLFANPLALLANGWDITLSVFLDNLQLGPWLQFTLDILGAPIASLKAFEDSVQTAFANLVMGQPLRAAVDVMELPFHVSRASLFGQDYIALPPAFKADGSSSAHEFYVHDGGLFAPGGYLMDYYTPSWSGIPVWLTYDNGGSGPQTGGIIPAMVSLLPPILQTPFHDLRRLLDGIAAKLMGLSALNY